MTTPSARSLVPFTLTHANALELLAGFRLAAVGVEWSREAAMQTVVEAMSGELAHLHATLSVWCLPAIHYRAN